MLKIVSLLAVAQVSTGYLGVKVVSRHNVESSHLQLSAADDKSPNMIGEQILELRDGLSTFQANAFESLYDKKVGWLKDDSSVITAPPSAAKEAEKVIAVEEGTESAATEIITDSVIDESPVAKKVVSNVAVKPIIVVDTEAKKEVIAVRDIPVRPMPEVNEELAAENKKRAIIQAQQAVTKSFLSLETPAPQSAAAGGFFSFLKSDNAVQQLADQKPTAPPSISKAFMAPTPAPVVEKVAAVEKEVIASRPTISTIKKAAAESSEEAIEVPPGGFFGFLKQGVPEVPKAVAKAPEPVAVKVEVVAPKVVVPPVQEAKKPAAGGFFSFLASDPNIVVTNKPSSSNIAKAFKAAPAAVQQIEEEVVAPVVPVKTAAPAPAGGLFGFLKSTPPPAAEVAVAKKVPIAPVVVAAKVQVPTPAPVPAPKAPPAPASGGFFGFMNPSAAAPVKAAVVVEEVIAPAMAKKATPVVAPKTKAPAPVARVVAAPAAVVAAPAPAPVEAKAAPSGGLFGFLAPKGDAKVAPAVKVAAVKVAAVKVAAPAAPAKAPAVGMNVKFQAAVSKLLKGDSNKIRAFQRATDDFRSDDVSGEDFINTLEALFGDEALESVVVPLVSELPERSAAVKLQNAYDKKIAAITKAATPAKSPFSFSFGATTKKATPPPPAPVVTEVIVAPVSVKKNAFSSPKPRAPIVSAAPAKEVAFKVPSKVPIAKKLSIEKQMKSLLSGSTDVKTFYAAVSKELGKDKTSEVMPDIIAVFPADIGSKLDAIFRASK